MTAVGEIITEAKEPMTGQPRQGTLREVWEQYQTWDALSLRASKAHYEAGLYLGQALYQLRAESEVVSGGTTFRATLESHGIPRATAYRWIARYEKIMGLRVEETVAPVEKSVKIESENNEADAAEHKEYPFDSLHQLRAVLNTLRGTAHQLEQLDSENTIEIVRDLGFHDSRELLIRANKAASALKKLIAVVQEHRRALWPDRKGQTHDSTAIN